MNKHKFVAGHGTVVQPASIKIVFGCKQAQQHSRTHQLGFYQSCQLACTKCKIAVVARAYHFYSRTLQFGVSSASRNHLTTFCRPFTHYAWPTHYARLCYD